MLSYGYAVIFCSNLINNFTVMFYVDLISVHIVFKLVTFKDICFILYWFQDVTVSKLVYYGQNQEFYSSQSCYFDEDYANDFLTHLVIF